MTARRLVEQRERDVEHALERGDRDPLGRLVVALGAVGEVHAREAAGLERVGVRAAAGHDPPRLVAAGAQRGLGGHDRGRARLLAVAGEQALGRRRRRRTPRSRRRRGWRRPCRRRRPRPGSGSSERASASSAAALGHDVGARRAALDRADVGGRLRRRCGRAACAAIACAAARIALRPVLGADAGVGGAAVEVGARARK